jgi:hypothetical protein
VTAVTGVSEVAATVFQKGEGCYDKKTNVDLRDVCLDSRDDDGLQPLYRRKAQRESPRLTASIAPHIIPSITPPSQSDGGWTRKY